MKTLLLSAAAALALTGPVFADAASFADQHFAQSETGGDGVRYMGQTRAGDVAYAIAHFAESRSGGDGPRVLVPGEGDVTVSTSNADLTALAKAKLSNGERGDN